MDERELPEGVIDAEPAGGWQDGEQVDAETERSNEAAIGETDYARSHVAREEAAAADTQEEQS